MDILYTLKCGSNCDELTYSLRTLRNIPHERVFIVGDCPDNIRKDKVVHIPTVQTGTKWKNSMHNFRTACTDNRLSEDFILMNDDFFILRPITEKDLLVRWGTMQAVHDLYFKKHGKETNWMRGMRETAELLKKRGISDPVCYDLHTPMILNKRKFLQLFELDGVKDIDVLHARSLYGNLYGVGGTYMDDVKYLAEGDFDPKKYDKFVSCSNVGFLKMKDFLAGKFNTKSEYEI